MGYGDEIIGSGLARGAAARGKKIAFGDGRKIIWTQWCKEVYENNPNIAWPGQEKAPGVEWMEFHVGRRHYSTLDAAKGRWIWNYNYRMAAGEFFFSEKEKAIAANHRSDFIVIEPNLPWWKPVAVNKDWGEANYAELGRQLIEQGYRLLQFHHANTKRIITGAQIIEVPRFRQAIAIMQRAAVYVGVEGGMMHAAAAVGLRGVILFGGWSPPLVVGHSWHVNITGSNEACGSIKPCDHCRQAMANISVEQVSRAVSHEAVAKSH